MFNKSDNESVQNRNWNVLVYMTAVFVLFVIIITIFFAIYSVVGDFGVAIIIFVIVLSMLHADDPTPAPT